MKFHGRHSGAVKGLTSSRSSSDIQNDMWRQWAARSINFITVKESSLRNDSKGRPSSLWQVPRVYSERNGTNIYDLDSPQKSAAAEERINGITSRFYLSPPCSLLSTHWTHWTLAGRAQNGQSTNRDRDGHGWTPSGVWSARPRRLTVRVVQIARETPTSRRSHDERPAPTVAAG